MRADLTFQSKINNSTRLFIKNYNLKLKELMFHFLKLYNFKINLENSLLLYTKKVICLFLNDIILIPDFH